MKRNIWGMLALLAVCLLAACSSYTYYSVGNGNNLSRYSTFAWLPPFNNTNNPYYNNDVADQRIKDQATADLESRGLHLRDRNPDLLVRYSIMVNTKVSTYNQPMYSYNWGGYYPSYRFYRGGGRGFYYRYGGAYPVYMGTEIYQVPYKEGTLIIDLIDRTTHKVIWRGYGIGVVNNPESAVNDLPKVVDGILEKLPLGKIK